MWISALVFSSSSFAAVNTVSSPMGAFPKKHEISAQTRQLCNHATNEFPIRTRSGLRLRWPRLLAHMIAVLCNFHKFLCVQNKQQKRWEKMALGLLVSNFYKFAQFFPTFLCFFSSSRASIKLGKWNFESAHKLRLKLFQELSRVCLILQFSSPPVPKKQIWFIYEKKKWWKILQTSKFSIRRISPGAHHACPQHCCAYISTNELLREKFDKLFN